MTTASADWMLVAVALLFGVWFAGVYGSAYRKRRGIAIVLKFLGWMAVVALASPLIVLAAVYAGICWFGMWLTERHELGHAR